jgi:hypothetical protein
MTSAKAVSHATENGSENAYDRSSSKTTAYVLVLPERKWRAMASGPE